MKKLATLIILILWGSIGYASDFHPGDKFISQTGDTIELIQQIPIYANDDGCLAMRAKGYLVNCEPDVIKRRWEVVIYHYGIEIVGMTDDTELVRLEKLVSDKVLK